MQALIGRHEHSLDAKNRLFVPSRFRDQLNEEGGKQFHLAAGLDGCLHLFLPSQWDQFLTDLKSQQFKSPQEKRKIERAIYQNAADAPLDDQGRILVPQRLKDFAGLNKEVVVVGVGRRAEIWDKQSYEKVEKSDLADFKKISAGLDL